MSHQQGIVGRLSHFIGTQQLYKAYKDYKQENYRDANKLFKEGALRFATCSAAAGAGLYYKNEISDVAQKSYTYCVDFFKKEPLSTPPPPKLEDPDLNTQIYNFTVWIANSIASPFVWIAQTIAQFNDSYIGFYPLETMQNLFVGNSQNLTEADLKPKINSTTVELFCNKTLIEPNDLKLNGEACKKAVLVMDENVKEALNNKTLGFSHSIVNKCMELSSQNITQNKYCTVNRTGLEIFSWSNSSTRICPSTSQVYAECVRDEIQNSTRMAAIAAQLA